MLFASCAEAITISGSDIPSVTYENLVVETRDFRYNETDDRQTVDISKIDYRKDEFKDGEITVNNSSFTIPENIAENIFSIMGKYRFDSGFYVIDTETGMSFGYNADMPFSTASTVKAGFALYCFKQVAEGNVKFNNIQRYERKHYITGSGSTKNSEYGTPITIKTLLYRMLYNSDNVAYYMLLDYFGCDGYNEMVAGLGVENHISETNKWGNLTPHELGLIWNEIYAFSGTCEEGELLWEYLTGNLYNEIADELSEYDTIAHKSGWSPQGYHDSGVVFADRVYIIVVMTSSGNRNSCLYETIRWIDDTMKYYDRWQKE